MFQLASRIVCSIFLLGYLCSVGFSQEDDKTRDPIPNVPPNSKTAQSDAGWKPTPSGKQPKLVTPSFSGQNIPPAFKPPVFNPKQFPEQKQLEAQKVAKTADEYLAQFDGDFSHTYKIPAMPKAELGKAAEALRNRFPLRSIRDRLHFQTEQPAPQKSVITGYQHRYSSALNLLHSDHVEKFIQDEGEGISRITPLNPRDLFPLEREKNFANKPVDSELLSEKPIALDAETKTRKSRIGEVYPDFAFINKLSPNGMPKQQLLSWFNTRTTREFASRSGFVRNVDEVAGFQPHSVRFDYRTENDIHLIRPSALPQFPTGAKRKPETSWKMNRLELVSLLLHKKPSVYVTDKLPNMESLSGKNVPTRALDKFESDSLTKLKSGEETSIHATRNRITMLGAIRANQKCLECHSVQQGDLLGAFSYEFLRDPRLTGNDSKDVANESNSAK